jgi:Sensors of blue-light using FAD
MHEQLVYVSRAVPGVGARAAYEIIRVSHNRNSLHQLTGALILIDGHFLQVLEGHSHTVRERFAVIAADPRHTDVSVRQSVATRERTFPDEWMALRHGDAIDEGLKLDFGYACGFPATHFDGPKLVEFALACYQPYRKTQSGAL